MSSNHFLIYHGTPPLKIDELTPQEEYLLIDTAEGRAGRKLDVVGICIEHPALLSLRDKGFIETKHPLTYGKIIYWTLTDKGKRKIEILLKSRFAYLPNGKVSTRDERQVKLYSLWIQKLKKAGLRDPSDPFKMIPPDDPRTLREIDRLQIELDHAKGIITLDEYHRRMEARTRGNPDSGIPFTIKISYSKYKMKTEHEVLSTGMLRGLGWRAGEQTMKVKVAIPHLRTVYMLRLDDVMSGIGFHPTKRTLRNIQRGEDVYLRETSTLSTSKEDKAANLEEYTIKVRQVLDNLYDEEKDWEPIAVRSSTV